MEPITLEVCVDSIESAIEAAKNGADRLELCAALSEGGLTPTCSFVKTVRSYVDIPLFCLIRPRRGPMVYNDKEKEIIIGDAIDLVQAGADGLVFGALFKDGSIDIELCKTIRKVARGRPCTFHRAFDHCTDPFVELESLISVGIERILTSGREETALEGSAMIRSLVERSNGRIDIMAAAGVTSENCLEILKLSGAPELHASARVKTMCNYEPSAARMGSAEDNILFVTSGKEVAAIKKAIKPIKYLFHFHA